MLEALDAAAVRGWGRAALASVEAHRAELDALNVFPIPDGDTGTNLVLTLRAGVEAMDATSADAAEALRQLARGAVLGARGNSGVIMSQLLRSLAAAAAGSAICDAAVLRDGLTRGARDARDAVKDPVEGTILTVAQAAADAVTDESASLAEVSSAALAAAELALLRTTQQLAELSRAGVVDAGGLGLVLVLEALARVVGAAGAGEPGRAAPALPRMGLCDPASSAHAYEVQYLLDAEPEAVAGLGDTLAALGDSVVVVGTGDGVWNIHVHVSDVGAAVEAGIVAGRPHRISVVRFADRVDALAVVAPAVRTGIMVIAVAPSDGLGRLFEGEGVRVVAGGTPSKADVVAAIMASGAAEVVLLPIASGITGVAEAAADRVRGDGIRVAVVPTRSPVQALAAVAVHDPSRGFEDDVVAMAEAAAATRFAEVTVAERESLTSVGICQAGDHLGLIDGEVVEIGRSLLSVAFAIIDRLLAVGAELLTVLIGADAKAGTESVIDRHVRERSPLTEVSSYQVGRTRFLLVIGAE